jgi:predicted RNA-binding protein
MNDRSTTRTMVREVDADHIILAPAGNSYEIRLVPTGHVEAGRRVLGRIEACALKVHPATGGGIFIEPIMGEPRIVAGRVIEVDAEASRVLVESVVPMTLTLSNDDDLQQCQEGGFINCHVESGATFTPAS